MICQKCGTEMALEKKIQLNFTSPVFKENGYFKVPDEYRNAEMYVCNKCKNVQFGAEIPEAPE